MRNKIVLLLLAVSLVLGSVFLTAAGGSGKSMFRSKCGQCHKSGGEAPTFAPSKYASKQWERFFKRNKHKRKKDITGIVTPGDVSAISKYLKDHAADSAQPEVAGLQ